MDIRNTVRVISVKQENPAHTTIELALKTDAVPGQFFMLTDYESGEKPFSVSRITDESVHFTIKKTGPFSKRLCKLEPGQTITVRGPYGNGFDTGSLYGKRVLMIGGGCGTAPLRSLLEAAGTIASVDFVNGARSADELLFPGGLIDAANQYDCTDDGSAGEKGTVLDICALHLRYTDYDSIAVSGPEPMLQAVINSLDGLNVPSFFLIERYMKCAIGICGQCSLDPDGVRVCVEGPVFERSRLAALTEFGSYKRDAAGLRRPFGV